MPNIKFVSDDVGVDIFAAAMKVRMAEAAAKGRHGWNDEAVCSIYELENMLRDKFFDSGVDPDQWLLDLANFAMMVYVRRNFE